MKFLECDLEEIIMNSSNGALYDRGLNINGKKINQISLGNYGRANIITIDRRYADWCKEIDPYISIGVYELKKDSISVSALIQTVRYCKGVCQWMNKNKPKIGFNLELVLVGRSIDTSSDLIYMSDLFTQESQTPNESINSISFYTYNYGIDGIQFKDERGYSLTEEGL